MARRVAWIWLAWEWIYLRFHPVTPIRPGSVFGFRRAGDVLELHLDGRALARMREQPGYSGFKAIRDLREGLGVLAGRIRSGELAGVTAIKGTSLMGEAGPVVGFETRPLPHNLANALQQYFLAGLDAIYNPGGHGRATRRWPAETWMNVEQLITLYGENSVRSSRAR